MQIDKPNFKSPSSSIIVEASSQPLVSVFGKGYHNNQGHAVPSSRPLPEAWSVVDIYRYIISDEAKASTLQLRRMVEERSMLSLEEQKAAEDDEKRFKTLNFMAVTFSGTFTYRNARSLQRLSGLMVIDVDDLESTEEARQLQESLCGDRRLTTALCFLSPRGRGVKWVIQLPEAWSGMPFREQFDEIYKYVLFEYGVPIDVSGSDVSRLCYLPWDEQCYVNNNLESF